MQSFVHETAIVDANVSIGDGTKIWHFSHVESGTKIGKNCVLGHYVYVGKDVNIGSGCKIQNGVSIYHGIELDDDVFCGPACVFTNDLNPRAEFPKGPAGWTKTMVRKGVTIGANATIVCGTEIGRYAFVAAGSVVTKDVPPYTAVMGVPAAFAYYICRCGTKLDKNHICPQCGLQYQINGTQVMPIE